MASITLSCLSQVVEAVDRCGPAHRLGAKLSEIQTGLRSVQKKLEQRSSTVIQAEDTQKVNHDEGQAPPPGPDSFSLTTLTCDGVSARVGRAGHVALVSGEAGGRRPRPGEARGRGGRHREAPGGPAAPLAARQAGGAKDRPHREGQDGDLSQSPARALDLSEAPNRLSVLRSSRGCRSTRR